MDATDTTAGLVHIRAYIANLQDALLALADPTIHRYSLDTGQETQSVTRRDIPRILNDLQDAYALCATLEARSGGGGVVQVVPFF